MPPFYLGLVAAGLRSPIAWRDTGNITPPAIGSTLANGWAGGARMGLMKAVPGTPGWGLGASATFWRGWVGRSVLDTGEFSGASYSVLSFDVDVHLNPVRKVPLDFYGLVGIGGAFVGGIPDQHGGLTTPLGVGLRFVFLQQFALHLEYRWTAIFAGHTTTHTTCVNGVCSQPEEKNWHDWFGMVSAGLSVALPWRR